MDDICFFFFLCFMIVLLLAVVFFGGPCLHLLQSGAFCQLCGKQLKPFCSVCNEFSSGSFCKDCGSPLSIP